MVANAILVILIIGVAVLVYAVYKLQQENKRLSDAIGQLARANLKLLERNARKG